MKFLKKFENLIIEKAIICSSKFIKILQRMNSPIAKAIIEYNEKGSDVVDNSYIDVTKNDGLISYLPASKELDRYTDELIDDLWNSRFRQNISIGKFTKSIINRMNLHFSDVEIEKFVNEYKSAQSESHFILVKDLDLIKKYYLSTNYDYSKSNDSSSLVNSCMRTPHAQRYLKIYASNESSSKLLVLLDNQTNLVMGRAIVWFNAINIKDNKPFIFMDRIYTVDDALEEKFKNYAISNGWYYKVLQTSKDNAISNGEEVIELPEIKVRIPSITIEDYVPYMDTMYKMGFEAEGENTVAYLYNSCCELKNVYSFLREQDGYAEANHNHLSKFDVYGKRNPNYKQIILKDYEHYYFIEADPSNRDERTLANNHWELIYSLISKDEHNTCVLSLAINIYDDVKTIVRTKYINSNNLRKHYNRLSQYITDIVVEHDLYFDYNDTHADYNFAIPADITNPEYLSIILDHVKPEAEMNNLIHLISASNKECANILIKKFPEILNINNTGDGVQNLLMLIKYGYLENDDINNLIQAHITDATYEDGKIWVKYKDYSELTFFFDNNEYVTSLFKHDIDFDCDFDLDDIDYRLVDDKSVDKIISYMEENDPNMINFLNDKSINWKDEIKNPDRKMFSQLIFGYAQENLPDICDVLRRSWNSSSDVAIYNNAYDAAIKSLESLINLDAENSKFEYQYQWAYCASTHLLDSIEYYYANWNNLDYDSPSYSIFNRINGGWDSTPEKYVFNEEIENFLLDL